MPQIPKRSSVSPRNPFLLSRCPPLPLGVRLNSCPLSRWCYLTISPSATPLSFCLQYFQASGSFPMHLLFTSGGPSIGALASVLPMNIQGWLPLGLIGLISLQSKGLSKSESLQHNSKASILWHSVFFIVQLSHSYMATGKTIALIIRTFVGKVTRPKNKKT